MTILVLRVLSKIKLRLLKPFSQREKSLKRCPVSVGTKAMGLNGFPMAFWQFAWDFVEGEILNHFLEFHQSGHFVRSFKRVEKALSR